MSQPNGVPAPSQGSTQTVPNTQTTQPTMSSQPNLTQTSSTSQPRPRDARLIELLLTSQGVTSYEQRVPLQLLDFAYRHTSSVLTDAIHLSGDPYITNTGSKGAAAPAGAVGDATVTANAVKLAIGARLSYQFRGGSAGGGISKEYMQELARERNKVSLPKIVPNEWGVRLPSERFVLSGTSWGLKENWDEVGGTMDEDQSEGGDAMEGVEAPPLEEPEDGDPVEGGTMDDVFGQDVDEEMAEES